MNVLNGPDFTPARVSPHAGMPALFINEQPVFPLLMMTTPDALKGLQDLGLTGFHLHTKEIPLGWVGIDRYDFTVVDERLQEFLEVDPDALIIPRVPVVAPAEWMDAHPDEVVQYADPASWQDQGGWGGPRHASWASIRWRNDASEALRRLVRHVREKFAEHIIGWHIGSGVFGVEWHYFNPMYYPDQSKVFAEAYAAWLARRYPVNTPPARLPTIQERKEGRGGLFHDPVQDRWMTDQAEFFHQQGPAALAAFAAAVKQESDRRSVVVAFYGYMPDLGIPYEGDHAGLHQVLRNPDVDILASPHTYRRRKPGQDASFRGFTGSVQAMGKLWLDEQDDRTHVAHRNASWQKAFTHVSTLEESVEILWRGFAQALTHGVGLWMMDQGSVFEWTKGNYWYNEPPMVDALNRMRLIGDQSMSRDRRRVSEVAVLCQYKTRWLMTDPVSEESPAVRLYSQALNELWNCGVPFDTYQMTEIFEPGVPDYKVYVFLDVFYMSDAELALVERLKRQGKTLLFFFAPALLSDAGLSIDRVKALLDMPVEAALVDKLGPALIVKGLAPCVPESALYRRGSVYFCPQPVLPSTLCRQVFREAGAHVYCDSHDVLMAGGGYVALHTATAGEKTLRCPEAVWWTDERSGRCTGPSREQQCVMRMGETVLFSVRPEGRAE